MCCIGKVNGMKGGGDTLSHAASHVPFLNSTNSYGLWLQVFSAQQFQDYGGLIGQRTSTRPGGRLNDTLRPARRS